MADRKVQLTITAQDKASPAFKEAAAAVDRLRAATEKRVARQNALTKAKDDVKALAAEYKAAQAAMVQSAQAMDAAFGSESLGTAGAREAAAAYREQKAEVERLARAVDAAAQGLRNLGSSNTSTFAAFSKNVDIMRQEAAAAREATAALLGRATAAQKASDSAQGQVSQRNELQTKLDARNSLLAADAARTATKAYEEMRRKTAELGRTLATTNAPSKEMIANFAQSKAELAGLRVEMERAITKSGALQSGFKAMSAAAAPETMAKTGGSWWSKTVEDFVGASATASERGPLGLRPYELQNLSYQINDLVTQVASGTLVMQAFAQQGGQIAQIFPTAVANLLKMIPAVAGVTAVMYPLIAAANRLKETGEIVRQFEVRIASSADGATYNAEGLTRIVRELEEIGISATESKTAILDMMNEGMSAERMEALLRTARDFSNVWGIELPEALQKVRVGFDGSWESIQQLDKSTNFLTLTQYKSIKALFDQGKAAEATAEALDVFSKSMDEAASAAETDWTRAVRDLSAAWRGFLDVLGSDFIVQELTRELNILSGAARGVVATLNSLNNIDVNDALWALVPFGEFMRPNDAPRAASTGGRARTRPSTAAESPTSQASLKKLADQADADAKVYADHFNKQLSDRLASTEDKRDQGRSEAVAVRTEREVAAAQALRDAEAKANAQRLRNAQQFEDARTNVTDDANTARQVREKKQADALKNIEQDLAETRRQTSLAAMNDADRAVAEAINKAETEAKESGIKLSATQRAEIEKTTRALESQREASKAAADQAKKAGKGKTADEERQEALEKTLNDLLERRRLLMEQIEYQDDSGNSAQADALRDQMGGVNQALEVAIANLREFWNASSSEEAATQLLKLDSFENELREIGKTAIVSGREMNEMLADAGTDGIDNWFDRMKEGESAIQALGNAFREVAADFLRQISQMIAKQMILNALQQGQGAGGGVGGFLSGLISGAVMHTGGIVGSGGGVSRSVSAALFANAPRYHSGGVLNAGLKRGEVPIIGQVGEEMLTRDDPRHSANGGGAAPNIRIINTLDPNDVLQAAVTSEPGQKAILNFMAQNAGRVRAAIGG